MKLSLVACSLVMLFVSSVPGCKKDETTQPPDHPATCNFTTNVVVVDGVSKNIIRVNNTEFLVDTSALASGVAMLFTTALPDPGEYAVIDDAASVTTGKVYVEFYDSSSAWHGTTGTVTVTATAGGAQRVIAFCNLALTAGPSDNKTVSLRGTTN